MFWKKEKPKFEVRPLYSIREELELIREFCWQPKLAAGKIYTEEEIDLEKTLLILGQEPVCFMLLTKTAAGSGLLERVQEQTGLAFHVGF